MIFKGTFMENFEKTNEIAPNVLKQQLEGAGIDTSVWGTGQAKTLAHLQKEIESGETILIKGKEGELLRKVVVGGADVFYVSPEGKKYRLKEDRQVFKDGRERRRDLGQAVSEKMKPDENPNDAMIRGIQEELGIVGEIILTETGTDEQLLTSPSYPGLQSQYIRHKFEAILNQKQFKQNGYVEEQPDKSTYFIWEEI
ncbi:MAG: hypothetical protein A3H02_00175 [Candidatus Niyogibacteria bacterium RIFCSPLOWO2_12_FULL_41_13]|uniref:Nudix hydrolase domain-containing protein n=1 Tax=Candidatus Niyogibacteria bacterium RIFCSPLOWO2_12_FULL_41_13 TaxID=1801726 RepID=A0A1G2F3B9_9BACT|nr:MAG: hypothetical protein A3H02_00175 [Candidatus Niyogibacteria bacterium RIFCSPLOWO2_12_FULL_41_13]